MSCFSFFDIVFVVVLISHVLLLSQDMGKFLCKCF